MDALPWLAKMMTQISTDELHILLFCISDKQQDVDLHSLRTQQEESLDQATPTATASAASEAAQQATAASAPTAVDNKSASAAAAASSASVGGAKPLNATESSGAGRTRGIDVMLSQNRPSKPSHVPIRGHVQMTSVLRGEGGLANS